jgi:putative solute:sodium symporter small subunit
MKETDEGYHISFFKPTTESARFNRNLVVWLASIWFIAIFGFHIVLKIIEKPTPEPAYLAFESVWDNIKNGSASDLEIQKFGRATLSFLGKIAIEADERLALSNGMSWSIYQLYPDTIQPKLLNKITEIEALKAGITDITDEEYVKMKRLFSKNMSQKLGLNELDARTLLLPIELSSANITSLSDKTVSSLPSIMEKYLIHNQSVLTDTVFLGFPFHYFYSAVFLLILFVGLCWIYCMRTDRRNAKLGIED